MLACENHRTERIKSFLCPNVGNLSVNLFIVDRRVDIPDYTDGER